MLLLFLCISADPLVGSIAAQYVSNREEHDKTAREWTRRYATWIKIETYWSLFISVNSSDVWSETPQDLNELILQRTGLNCMLFCNAEKKKSIKIGVWELGTRDSKPCLQFPRADFRLLRVLFAFGKWTVYYRWPTQCEIRTWTKPNCSRCGVLYVHHERMQDYLI